MTTGSRVAHKKASTVEEIKKKVQRYHLYFLNAYVMPKRALRIELAYGGDRCWWKERTTLKKMQETKRYLEKRLGIVVEE